MSYVEIAADYAFTQFLASVTPADLAQPEWDLYQHLRLRRAK
jgi:hypothetical protein